MEDNSWEESRRIHLRCGHSYHHKRFRELLHQGGVCSTCNQPFDQRAIDHFNKIENPQPRAPQTFSPFIEEQETDNVYISPQTKVLMDKLNGNKPSNSWWWPFQFGKGKLKIVNKEIKLIDKEIKFVDKQILYLRKL